MTTKTSSSAWKGDPDVQLMLRAKSGDQNAFNQLVVNYQDRLIGIFGHLVGGRDAAEDLVQEVFLRVYRARNGYKPTAKFSTWLFRIANNLASNTRRNAGRRKEVSMGPQESGPMGTRPDAEMVAEKSALMPSRQADRKELQKTVKDALETLNERQRMAVLLHKFEGMSYADIGDTMEMSSTAVKSLLSRARENLRTKLEGFVKA